MHVVLLVVVGCAGRNADGTVIDGPPAATTGGTASTGGTGATGGTGDTASTPPEPVWPDDCDPNVYVPATGGIDPAGVVDPHDTVYGAEPIPFAVRYSWPGTDPSTSAAFLWRTDTGTLASAVELQPLVGAPITAEGASFTYGPVGTDAPVYRIHEVKLCQQLTPGTSYRYRVGGPGAWSPYYEFTTPGAPGSFDTFRVAIAGDSRGSYATWQALVLAAEAHEPDFWMFTGDAVTAGVSQAEWDVWYVATGGVFAERALVPAHGNHEALAVNWFAQVSLPGNEQWYRIRYGTLDLAVLNDSSILAEDRTEQAAWLADTFGTSTATWKVAIHHQSPYATCTRHGSNLDLRTEWVPVYESLGFDAVFNGHNHIYERSTPILQDAVAEEGPGITYVVTGGAGAPLYANVLADWFSNVANPIEHYAIADFSPAGTRVIVRDLAGNVIDDFTLAAD